MIDIAALQKEVTDGLYALTVVVLAGIGCAVKIKAAFADLDAKHAANVKRLDAHETAIIGAVEPMPFAPETSAPANP